VMLMVVPGVEPGHVAEQETGVTWSLL